MIKPRVSAMLGGAALFAVLLSPIRLPAAEEPGAASVTPDTTAISSLEQRLKEFSGQLPSQSHTMADVAYHFSNLWFAAKAKNWPLAEFYANETRSHLRWAVRVRPVRPLAGGGELRLADMLATIEQTTLKEVQDSVRAQDPKRFSAAYKEMLAGCYSCHVAAQKPYLRLHIPERPPETMVEFAPGKTAGPQK
jgi:hypothetical protein